MKRTIHWFQQDFRLNDNPSLFAAAKQGSVLPLYIFDQSRGNKPIGAASRCWLHHSLDELNRQLSGKLTIQRGDALIVLLKLIKSCNIEAVFWNRCYEPCALADEKRIKKSLESYGVTVTVYKAYLLWEPWEVTKKDGGNYQVFTPFYYKGCLQSVPPRNPLPMPKVLELIYDKSLSCSLASLNLLPDIAWDKKVMQHWEVGEAAARKRFKNFINKGLHGYQSGRDNLSQPHLSYLSPYLHWGQISVYQLWYAIKKMTQNKDTDCFMRQLGWREFSYSLLCYYPKLDSKNLQAKFDKFPWKKSRKKLLAWQQGKTGYPIVDAGMRELWQTGFMHNRVRMIVASFLVKNLMIHWHEGEAWFWDCLLDADLANNSASWQWVAGCGADAAPFFRIFNPVTQGKKFDAAGEYIRSYVPELAGLPLKYLFSPWEAPQSVLREAGITLGKDYPLPIVDLKVSRDLALTAFKLLKKC